MMIGVERAGTFTHHVQPGKFAEKRLAIPDHFDMRVRSGLSESGLRLRMKDMENMDCGYSLNANLRADSRSLATDSLEQDSV